MLTIVQNRMLHSDYSAACDLEQGDFENNKEVHINFILSGEGTAVCDGQEEKLEAGVCHICLKGSEHSIANTGTEDFVMLTVVVER